MTTKPIVIFSIDPALLKRIDAYWHKRQFPSRAATIKALVTWALEQNPKLDPKGKTKEGGTK